VGFRSPRAGLFQAFIQAAMLLFPVSGSDLDRLSRVQTFESEGFKFFFCRLVCSEETLDGGGHGKPLGFRPLSQPRLKFRVDCDGWQMILSLV
jgi:hypothetical protein